MLAVKVHNLKLKNPVMTASGTFGYGEEFADFVDLERLGGFIVKGTTGTVELFFPLLYQAASSAACRKVSSGTSPSVRMITWLPGMSLACSQVSLPAAACVSRSFCTAFFPTQISIPSSDR